MTIHGSYAQEVKIYGTFSVCKLLQAAMKMPLIGITAHSLESTTHPRVKGGHYPPLFSIYFILFFWQ